jgi:hypothetical protein
MEGSLKWKGRKSRGVLRTVKSKIGGGLPVKCRMELVPEEIRGDFPAM